MNVLVLTPTQVVLECEAVHVTAEAPSGSLGVRPGHAPLVGPLVRGVLLVRRPDGSESYVAVDRGVLLVENDMVRVVTRQAVTGTDLEQLERTAQETFERQDEERKSTRVAFEKMRLQFMRGLLEFEQAGQL